MSFGTIGKSDLGSPTTTSVLGSRRKQACFMAVMTAVTEPSCHAGYGTRMADGGLTSVSPPELIFSDQKVSSLVVVPKPPNIGAVLHIRNLSPTNTIVG